MAEMKEFVLWLLANVPAVLLQPPISAFTGIMLLYWTGDLVKRMINL